MSKVKIAGLVFAGLVVVGVASGSSSESKGEVSPNVGPTSTTTSDDSEVSEVKYSSCSEAPGPLRKGDPGYSRALDRDGDGIACDEDAKPVYKLKTSKIRNGWFPEIYDTFYTGWMSGATSDLDLYHCGFDWIIDNKSPEQVIEWTDATRSADMDKAVAACIKYKG